ncbi:threonylcarbamoyl-AMP synthase [Georgenia sp. 311]|uniref:Threonylcarbamoyl-AMP synthase n=1 Tax=Georgenia wutianyii TaxID=2585135 RepID=A0ABX5VLW0_9MICO|nr:MULTISPECIES: L-threonylcarbamoyladenylate synthase [Georgenia]QDB78323.1 threonylcarbamoyl-AMP synthase [Georgenia wutianyii]TNC20014.1 threonylcarbamoyl-AMP synthase [Georgenia sp. 311]
MARLVELHPQDPQPRRLGQVVDVLRGGGLIAYPTDSGYALGARLGSKEALNRIREIRRLDDKHHFTLMCATLAQAGTFVILDNRDFRLVKSLTPGPYTFIVKATKDVPRMMLQPRKLTVGVRVPDHRVALAILGELGEPMLTSTLILPGAEEPMSEGWVVDDEIGRLLDVVVDAPVTSVDPTTVVDLTSGAPEVIREGAGDVSRFG